MTVNNNAKLIRRDLLIKLSKIILEGKDYHSANRIPLELRPRKGDSTRCCIYRDRAVLKYKIMAMLGFCDEQEEDELKSLGEYIYEAEQGLTSDASLLNVVEEACSACKKNNYVVTNMCQACVGRPCQVNCRKNAISFREGRAHIDPHDCVNCGLCMKVCPFHAIIYTPVPCEEACPVGAISKNEEGKEHIDMENCILCGKCMDVCPFGAIVEKTDLFKVMREQMKGNKLVAIVAPAVAGQFREPMSKILGSFLELGFQQVREVAAGADITARMEAEEFREKAARGENMTTSCCPAYVNLIEKHAPGLGHFLSETLSPMRYTAEQVKKEFPDARLVFVGPCLSKKQEALRDPAIDYVLNFEEFGAWLVSAGIELADCRELEPSEHISAEGRLFARAGGVGSAVKAHLEGEDLKVLNYDNIDRTFLRQLKKTLEGERSTLVEVMSCENGCIGGCSTLTSAKIAQRQLNDFARDSSLKPCH